MAMEMFAFDFGGRFWGKRKSCLFPPCAEPQSERERDKAECVGVNL